MVPDSEVCVNGLRKLYILVKNSKAYETAAPNCTPISRKSLADLLA